MTKPKIEKSAYETALDWFKKIDFLNNQISSLEKIKDIPLISISVFLLKTQYIEFQLKQLITSLDQHLFFSNTSPILRPQTRTPKKLGDDGIRMLGEILNELKKYKGDLLKQLISYLGKLRKERNKFTHQLYDSDSTIQQLHKEAEKGIQLANKVISEIKNVEKELKANDPLK